MYQQCKRCVMDTTADEFVKTDTGCYFCDLAMANKPRDKHISPTFVNMLDDPMKLKTNHEKYDVLLGLSGGVDSSYTLHLLNEMGVRVLCYSIDNGWNDPKADENMMKLVEGMKVPFIRYTIDLEKFQELQGAFLSAGVKNLEIPTDHILMASAYEIAKDYGIKTIISGGNWNTESIMPRSWGYQPRDLVHIKAIYKRITGRRLQGLPVCGLLKWNWYKWINKIQTINLLDSFAYNREEAIKLLEEKYGFKPYGEKHCENIYTWWFMNFYLFEKWGIDKRKAHLSSLILSGQMTRDEAMKELEKNPVYPKLGIENRVLRIQKHDYTEYPNDEKLFNFISKVIKTVRDYLK